MRSSKLSCKFVNALQRQMYITGGGGNRSILWRYRHVANVAVFTSKLSRSQLKIDVSPHCTVSLCYVTTDLCVALSCINKDVIIQPHKQWRRQLWEFTRSRQGPENVCQVLGSLLKCSLKNDRLTVLSVVKITFSCWKRISEAQHKEEERYLMSQQIELTLFLKNGDLNDMKLCLTFHYNITDRSQSQVPFLVAGHRTCQDLTPPLHTSHCMTWVSLLSLSWPRVDAAKSDVTGQYN